MGGDPLVSVVIPCRNAARFLGETLESVERQTWPNLEIVLVDDGSSDDTVSVARRHRERGRIPIRILRQPARGACAARNRGLAESRGEFVQWLDADDLLEASKIADQVGATTAREGIVYGPWFHLYEEDGIWKRGPMRRKQAVDDPLREQIRGLLCPVHSYLARRDVYEEVGGWDETLTADQDGDLFMRLAVAGIPFHHVRSGAAVWRQRTAGDRVSRRRSRDAWESRMRVCDRVRQALTDRGDLDSYREVLAQRYDGIARGTAGSYPDLARECIRRARSVRPGYRIPGGPSYRVLRRLLGLSGAEWVRRKIGGLRGRPEVPAWYLETDH